MIVGLGAFSIAIRFATSTIIQNLVSEILVQANKAFRDQDEIKVLNLEEKVIKINMRKAILETSKSRTIFINSAVIRKTGKNRSHLINLRLRLSL